MEVMVFEFDLPPQYLKYLTVQWYSATPDSASVVIMWEPNYFN
jgi:hypothetical protein